MARLALATFCLAVAIVGHAAPDTARTGTLDVGRVKALLAAAEVPCTVSASLQLKAPAPATTSGKRSRTVASVRQPDRFEVSCHEGLGYIVAAAPDRDTRPSANFCFERTSETPPTICMLQGNRADAQRGALSALLAKAGKSYCDMDRFRLAGRSVAATYIEVSCRNTDGYVVAASNPFDPAKKVAAVPCMNVPEVSEYACQLSEPMTVIEAMSAAAEAMFTRESGRSQCRIHGRRHMMTDAAGNAWFEFMCQNGANYIMARLANGKFGGTDDCTAAVATDLGGCKLPRPAGK